jgi:hypothetical protein
VSAFRQLSEIRLDEWPLLYGRPVAAGCGLVIDPELERTPAADELVAHAVRG